MYAGVKNETSLSGITELNMTYDQATDKFTLSASKSIDEVEVDSILTLFFKDGSTGTINNINLDLYSGFGEADVEVDYLPMIDGISDDGNSTLYISFDTAMSPSAIQTPEYYEYMNTTGQSITITSIAYDTGTDVGTLIIQAVVSEGDQIMINTTEPGIVDENGFSIMQS